MGSWRKRRRVKGVGTRKRSKRKQSGELEKEEGDKEREILVNRQVDNR